VERDLERVNQFALALVDAAATPGDDERYSLARQALFDELWAAGVRPSPPAPLFPSGPFSMVPNVR